MGREENVWRADPDAGSPLEIGPDFFAGVVESAEALILVLDETGSILHANRAARRATGYQSEELRGRAFVPALAVGDVAAVLGDGLRRLRDGADTCPFEGHLATRTGGRLLVAGSLTSMRDADGVVSHVVVTASDITERVALEDQLRELSLRDPMTGLYNRRGFALLAEQRLKESRRSGSDLTIFYADADRLKTINDEFGHDAGDIALRLCTQALGATFRESDVVARVGGDEFVVLAEGDARELDTVGGLLTRELERRIAVSGLRFDVSMTLGNARLRAPSAGALDAALHGADRVMYERKRHSRPQAA
jgi:diguanylate cyclase (GGDEF)-like protein/PAS domain S-box-containing protein